MTMQHIGYSNEHTGGIVVCSYWCPLCELHARLASLVTLAHNLAVAAFGAAMFRAGDNHGFHMGSDESQCTCQWSPNVHGEAYRGSTRCEQDVEDDDYYARAADLDDDEPLGCCPRHTWGDEFHDPGCTGAKQ